MTDPTHVREYASADGFRAALEHPRLALEDVRTAPLRFPVVDLAARAAAFARLLPFERLPRLYVDRPGAARLRRVQVRVPGYFWIEAVGRRI